MTPRTCPANAEGHTLYRWVDATGLAWACAAYDHGPFCRLCSPVAEELTGLLLDRVEAGALDVHTEADGQLTFTPRDAGRG